MKCPPRPSMLVGRSRDTLNWSQVLGELIDNAFDAAATNINIRFGSGRTLEVTDDGNGCDTPSAMLTLGEHHKHASTKLGRYGVGLYDAACWMWGICRIETVSRGKSCLMSVDWAKLVKTTDWTIPDPFEAPSTKPTGTTLLFSNIQRGLPKDYKRLVSELAYTFTPALLQGRQLRFQFAKRKPIVATPYQAPPLEDIIEDAFDVDGRSIRLRVGVIREGHDTDKPGFTYYHHHRVIIPSSGLGSGGEYSIRRVIGQVFLGDSWHLSVHKDDIADHRDELGDAVFERCQGLLKKAHRQAQTVSSQAFTNQLNKKLRAAMKDLTKAKRGPSTNNTGTITPKGTGRKTRKAKAKQPGDSMLSDEQVGKLRIDWLPCDGETLGKVDRDGALIWMNEGNTYLSGLRDAENDDALLCVAIGMYTNAAARSTDPQKWFPGLREHDPGREFVPLWSRILSSIKSTG